MSKILGIDPGFAILGWGIVESSSNKTTCNVEWGVIKTHLDNKIEDRIYMIYEGLLDLLNLYKPTEIAMEKVFFNNNAKTAIRVSQVQGVIILLSVIKKIPIFEYTPLQVKSALTGYGVADKKQVQNMLKLLLKLDDVPRPDDAADGVAIAMCHLQTHKFG